MYHAVEDPYCYPGTTVLRNLPGLRRQATLTRFETAMAAQRADEPFPAGRLGVRHYKAIHRHLFQDVYAWAGKFRTVRVSKERSVFCYPENIAREMRALFSDLRDARYMRGDSKQQFVEMAVHFLATLNAIHPFRDGNGRTQLAFLALVGAQAGHPLVLTRLDAQAFLTAMIRGFHGDEGPVAAQLSELVD
jgi:cell filamentation protein